MKKIILCGLFCLSALLSAGSKPEPAGRTILTAALNGPTGIGLIQMMDQPPQWAGEDTLKYQVVVDPKLLVPSLLKGEYQAAVVPSNMAALVTAKGAPYKIAAVVGYGVLYVVGSQDAPTALNELKGTELHLSGKGATPDYLTQYFLNQAGIDPLEDITLNYSFTHPDLTKALISGRVEQALLPEPFATMALMGNSELSVTLDYQELWEQSQGDNYPISVLLVSQEMVDDMGDLLPAYLQAYSDSIDWVNSNIEQAAALVPQYGFTLKEDVLIEAIPRCNLQFSGLDDSKEELEAFFTALHQLNPASVGGNLPGDNAYLP